MHAGSLKRPSVPAARPSVSAVVRQSTPARSGRAGGRWAATCSELNPLHEMPILDLRIRKAVRRGEAKLMVASERPTALDGGAGDDPAGRAARRVRVARF